MSNKDFKNLNELDLALRRAFPPTMNDEVQVTIKKICGFELFNTRKGHNYESWSDGYRVEGFGLVVEAEDLDDAIKLFISKCKEQPTQAQEKGGGG